MFLKVQIDIKNSFGNIMRVDQNTNDVKIPSYVKQLDKLCIQLFISKILKGVVTRAHRVFVRLVYNLWAFEDCEIPLKNLTYFLVVDFFVGRGALLFVLASLCCSATLLPQYHFQSFIGFFAIHNGSQSGITSSV